MRNKPHPLLTEPAEKNKYGTQRLTNKSTGRLASKTNWLLDLAAEAVDQRETEGIPALLPQEKAKKLLKHNHLQAYKSHRQKATPAGMESTHKDLRNLARRAYPELACFYLQSIVPQRKETEVNRKGFRAWLMTELATPGGTLNKFLQSRRELSPLAELKRGDDWWRSCLKTESKSQSAT